MNLVLVMLVSIGIKAISAVVEIAIQMLITHEAGVSHFGDYTFFVSLIEGAYFVLFSGTIKLNTFYLSTPSSSLSTFKRKYNLRYVTPIIAVVILCFAILKNPYGILAGVILFVYYFAFDTSSVFFSRGHQMPALFGEYLFGRIVMFIGVITTIKLHFLSGLLLFVLYGIQFITMLLWFLPLKHRLKRGTEEIVVPIRKLVEYQISDVASSLISYSPTILQYIVGGAFTAGFTGIITIIKRFINFISGPTAKVFLPEFSRLYKSGERKKLEQSYLMIVRIQMLFIGTIGAVLICFPRLVLHMFSPDLEQYGLIFTGTAISILFIAGIGPVTGMLQMTGNERICNRNQWISIGLMAIVCIILRNEPLFAVYGLCVQAVSEGLLKYYSVCRWFGKSVVPMKTYAIAWLPVAIIRVIVDQTGLQYSFFALVGCAFLAFCWNALFASKDPMIKQAVFEKIKTIRKK